jgi:2-polyprenyl-6-methoxyphenol hydroxylase-like FAD-dependent oxidoreductase
VGIANSTITTQCCIAGGGPAGMMLGFLLARAGVHVVVLEKHADFFRDFRGDTVHPSTLELMFELGLIDEFLKLPHRKVETVTGQVGAERLVMGDFRHLPTHCKFIALMPQWDLLNFLAQQGKRYAKFDLRMQAEATELIEENGRIAGLIARTPDGALTIRADLTVGCDGRHSTVREKASLLRGADGRAVVPPAAEGRRHHGCIRPHRSGQDHGDARSGRLMAMRLCHSEGRD